MTSTLQFPVARSELWTPLLALDRLNSWLRAEQPAWCQLRSALKPVIYWTKTQAILDMTKRWPVEMRRVMVKKPCRRCDGTGQWISFFADWHDADMSKDEYRANYGERCHGCKGTGTATLKFVETNIGPIRWHTPVEKWFFSSLDTYVPFPTYFPDGDEHYELANGWEPNQEGRPLSPAEVERDSLLVLRRWPKEFCFALDFHQRAGTMKTYGVPDVRKAQRWLAHLFNPTENPYPHD